METVRRGAVRLRWSARVRHMSHSAPLRCAASETVVETAVRAPVVKEVAVSDTASEKYVCLTAREHVRQRPDMYVGSVTKESQKHWLVKV